MRNLDSDAGQPTGWFPKAARHWRPALLTLLGTLLGLGAQAQKPAGFFADDAAAQRAAAGTPLRQALKAARPLTLNVTGLRGALAAAPLEGRPGAPLLLTIPMPDGSNARFEVREAPVMEPGLAAKFPDIKTYAGVGLDDPTATLRLDLTPAGFHAQVLSASTGDFYIDPTTRTDQAHYLSFWKHDMPGRQFECRTPSATAAQAGPTKATAQAQRAIAGTLRTYRVAVAATGEYSATRGGTVALAQAAIVTSVNRVVGVYEKELDVRMVLVANNSSLVYLDGTTDPYTNDDGSTMLGQNQTNVDKLIGSANYDIGHVFSTGGGGIAGLGVVCNASRKANGVTGLPNPVGDAFDIDYVAHEMGHQFGANHPFNGNGGSCAGGNRNASTAYEPGSGTTIMAYAGICGAANDLQPNSDAYFHVVSYEEIQTYLGTTSCAVTSTTGNNAPTVTLPAGGKVLPISTPFKLTAGGYDSDGDAITFCWEQYNLGTQGSPTAAQTANNNVPLFRSFSPTTSPTRYFPRLADVISGTATLGERLPTVNRNLTFRVTVRDQHNGSQGVVGGINSSPNVVFTTTASAGPFLVTSPNTAVTLDGGSSQTVTWNVAGTNANGVNCATVNIRLSTDGGLTYPTLLLAGTANDGSEAVTLPSVATTTARVMVEAADNYFYDISNANFTIAAPTPCDAPTALSVSNVTGTSASVSFTASSTATSYVVTTVPATTTQTVTASPASLTGLNPGVNYTVYIQSACAGNTTSNAASTTFSTTAPPVCNEVTGLTFSNVTATSATVSFTATTAVTSYVVTTSPATTTQTITGTTASFTGLTPGTAYTVSIQSNCVGGGQATATGRFGTKPTNDECANAVSITPGTTCVTTAGSISGSTQSQVASTCSGYASSTANDVWYSFVATAATQTVRVVSDFDAVVETLSGTCGSLTSVSCIDDAGAGTETLSLTGLTVNTRYYVRVYPYTENSVPVFGTFTICVTGAAPTCNAPTNLAISNITGTTATLSFTSNLVGGNYTVTTSPATTTYTVGTSPVTLTGLTVGTSYTVSVVGNCASGTTLPAATVTFTATQPCNAPTALSVGSIAATTASVSFTASSSATTYTVTTSPATTTQTVTASPFTLTGLTPSTAYTVSIVSNCAGGATSSAATTTFTTAAPPCNAPTAVAVSSITSTTASVSFTASSTATGYTVTTVPATTTQTVTASPFTLTGLTPSTAYTVRIVSNCASNTTSSAATATFTTAAPPCLAPTALATSNVTTTGATISFTPSSAGLAYTVTTSPATTAQTVTASPFTLTGLIPGTAYTVSIVSNCAGNVSSGAATVSFTTVAVPCDAPTGIVTNNLSGTSTAVRFTPSATATSYTVTTVPATVPQTVTASPFNLTGLTPGTAYTVRIVSNCTAGATSSAATATFTSAVVTASISVLDAGLVSIAPNPAHGSFTLQVPAIAGQREVRATLLNVLGQAVAKRSIALTATGASAEFDVHSLAQGVYILRLEAGDQAVTRRLTVD